MARNGYNIIMAIIYILMAITIIMAITIMAITY